jgi:hypothetical protein
MPKFIFSNNTTYSEVSQVNPMRWKTLFREDANTFTDQSGWIKCKDFYNDTVAFFRNGMKFGIYGYINSIKKNTEGVYFLLKGLKDKKSFLANLDVINKRLKKDLNCSLSTTDVPDEADQMVVLIPNECWESTYRISLVTMCIRLSNYGVTYQNWEDIWSDGAPWVIDKVFDKLVSAYVSKNGFTVPMEFSKYWYYSGSNHNSEQLTHSNHIIHDCGVMTWLRAMKFV